MDENILHIITVKNVKKKYRVYIKGKNPWKEGIVYVNEAAQAEEVRGVEAGVRGKKNTPEDIEVREISNNVAGMEGVKKEDMGQG